MGEIDGGDLRCVEKPTLKGGLPGEQGVLRMNRSMVLMASFSLCLCGAGVESQTIPVQCDWCDYWRVSKLTEPPEWYVVACETQTPAVRVDTIGDSLVRTDYLFPDSSVLAYFERLVPEERTDDLQPRGRFYAYGVDTVLIDSTTYWFGPPSFFPGTRSFVVAELLEMSGDHRYSNIVEYNLDFDEQKDVLFPHAFSRDPQVDPSGRWVAFSDWGDLYIYPDCGTAAELVFKGGGGWAQCNPQWMDIGPIRWSPDGSSLVFSYMKSIYKDETAYYEVQYIWRK